MKTFRSLLCLLCLLSLAACGTAAPETPDQEPPETITFSSLTDRETRSQAAAVMTAAGVSAVRQQAFFAHVDQFNAVAGPENLTDGFETLPISSTKFDPYALQTQWDARYPDFPGLNCRITAFSLFGDLVTIPSVPTPPGSNLFMDMASLEQDSTLFPVPEDTDRFALLYTEVSTAPGKEIEPHLDALREVWHSRGISFPANSRAKLISMVFHNDLDEPNTLFIGHTGVLFPVEEGELYFLEKLAFQEPYRWIRFHDRTELSDYLMLKYDLDVDQPTAPPFILENDRLMEGYRPRPAAQ